MVSYYPSMDAVQGGAARYTSPPVATRLAPRHDKPTPYQARPELYGAAFSVVDDAKDKARQLSADAQKEFDKAVVKAKPAAAKMELYSGSYYAACTFGGLLACVSQPPPRNGFPD